MTDDNTHELTDDTVVETDGGAVAGAPQRHQETDYLNREVNLLKPSTPFMRDHLKLVWTSFLAWVLLTWGPVVLTLLGTDSVTTQMPVLGFPLHYFLVAFVSPTSSLILAAIYSWRRDKLDEKYGIDTSAPSETVETAESATATDGGVDR
jgi:putative solute:sodium symporter small subunit